MNEVFIILTTILIGILVLKDNYNPPSTTSESHNDNNNPDDYIILILFLGVLVLFISNIHIFLIYLFVTLGLDCLNDFLKRKSNNKDEQPVEEQTYVDMEKEIKDLQKQLKRTRAYLFLLIVCFALYMDK